MALICMPALGWHVSVISQSLSHTGDSALQESDSIFQASTPSLFLNTGVPSEYTETNLIIHRSTEVTTEKNRQYSCKKYVYIFLTNNNVGAEN